MKDLSGHLRLTDFLPPQTHCEVKEFVARLQTKILESNTPAIFDEIATLFQQQKKFTSELVQALYASDYVQGLLFDQPEKILGLADGSLEFSALAFSSGLQTTCENLKIRLNACKDAPEFAQTLRQLRKDFMLQSIWRDANSLGSMEELTYALSVFAGFCLQASLDYHYQLLCVAKGVPRASDGTEQGMLILGMGKLGAWELNLSSDIDLIFCYPEKGTTDSPHKPLENQQFFSELGKKIINSLDAKTAEGRVFRVDMRLRPYGQSGALVCSFRALENYYLTQGREWERYAMVKARVVASTASPSDHANLMDILRGFTYRKYIDFSVIDALRKLKMMINQEVSRRGLGGNIKTGPGGIREIEFIAQVFQLIRGGRDRQLQDTRLKVVLSHLVDLGCIESDARQALWRAYVFLRNTEHALQAWKDKQTQQLPADEASRLRLARVMGFVDWDAFFVELESHRHFVNTEFQLLITPIKDKHPEEGEAGEKQSVDWAEIWYGSMAQAQCLQVLEENGHEDPQRSLELLKDLRQSGNVLSMQASGRERLDEFVPQLMQAVSGVGAPSETLARIMTLVRAIVRRSAYLVLLVENPLALQQLIKLSVASPWISDRLAKHPALLDELLDQRTLYCPPEKQALEAELQQHMLRVPLDDLEAQMEALRYFKMSHALRVAASEVTGVLPLMNVSDYLSWLAEALLNYVLELAWREMLEKHGPPASQEDQCEFIIVAYGKLGGIELGHGSDLDLVFIFDADVNGQTQGDAEGKRKLDNSVFFIRLGQKIIHILNSNLASGQLYEVDMRLRPSGNAGLLVSSFDAFEKYQKEAAWTWEHQALVRARTVSGSPGLAAKFAGLRERILSVERDLPTLAKDVREMREKMREHLGSDKKGLGQAEFNLKQDPGGIVDIEFMVQYAVLAWAHKVPGLAKYSDNIRILECLGRSELLGAQEVLGLTEAYKVFRSITHSLTLQQQASLVDGSALEKERHIVSQIWRQLLGEE